jgi:hypothetical protein
MKKQKLFLSIIGMALLLSGCKVDGVCRSDTLVLKREFERLYEKMSKERTSLPGKENSVVDSVLKTRFEKIRDCLIRRGQLPVISFDSLPGMRCKVELSGTALNIHVRLSSTLYKKLRRMEVMVYDDKGNVRFRGLYNHSDAVDGTVPEGFALYPVERLGVIPVDENKIVSAGVDGRYGASDRWMRILEGVVRHKRKGVEVIWHLQMKETWKFGSVLVRFCMYDGGECNVWRRCKE